MDADIKRDDNVTVRPTGDARNVFVGDVDTVIVRRGHQLVTIEDYLAHAGDDARRVQLRFQLWVQCCEGLIVTVRTKTALESQITTLLADNDAGDISEGDVRSVLTDMLDSLEFAATANHNRYAAWSTDDTVVASDLTAGASSMTNTLTAPTATGNQYLGLWRSAADGGDFSEVHISGAGNSRNLFGAASSLTVSGTAGKLIVSVNTFNATLVSGEMIRGV